MATPEIAKDIGRRVQHARLTAKLTQRDVAKRFDIDKSTVSRWETGDTLLGLDTLETLATMFGTVAQKLAFASEFDAKPTADVDDECDDATPANPPDSSARALDPDAAEPAQ